MSPMYTDNFQGYEMRPCDTQNIHFNVNVTNDKLQDANDFPFHLIPSAYTHTDAQLHRHHVHRFLDLEMILADSLNKIKSNAT